MYRTKKLNFPHCRAQEKYDAFFCNKRDILCVPLGNTCGSFFGLTKI